jgi:hypothetical protein
LAIRITRRPDRQQFHVPFLFQQCQEQIENPAEQKKTAALCGAAVEFMG